MQMIEGIVVADGNQDVARANPDIGRREIRFLSQIELVELRRVPFVPSLLSESVLLGKLKRQK